MAVRGINKVILVGRLGKDPEVNAGNAVPAVIAEILTAVNKMTNERFIITLLAFSLFTVHLCVPYLFYYSNSCPTV